MAKVRFVFAVFVVLSVFTPLARPVSPVAAADDPAGVGFVSGQWRVVAQAMALVTADTALGVKEGETPWLVVIADVTNTGTSVAPFTLADLSATVDGDALSYDAASTVAAQKALKLKALDASGSISLPEDSTERVALLFATDGDVDKDDVAFGIDVDTASLESVFVEKIVLKDLPSVTTWSVTQAVLDRDDIGSVALPPSDGCYGAEVDDEIQRLTGGSVWNEPSGDLTWYWDAAQGHLVPLQASLVEGGFATATGKESSTFGTWLASKGAAVKSDKDGLWSLCKDARGTWINEPTKAPPSAEEIRAGYIWVDTRELVTRPFVFDGEKIAVSGTVFTIQAEPGFTGMQIWVDTPNGQEAVVIAYRGDLPGVYEGTYVTVYGVGNGTFEGTNGFGATIVQPLIIADIVDY